MRKHHYINLKILYSAVIVFCIWFIPSFSNIAYSAESYNIDVITTDRYRANTKIEDEDNLLNEGKRFRHLEYAVFLTPDPKEYVDGLNQYIYVGQNPWGRFDPHGLEMYLLYHVGADNSVFEASATTRQKAIESSKDFNKSKDIVIRSSIRDISDIKKQTESAVAQYSGKYGATTEVGIWSHSGLNDGPVGLDNTSRHPFRSKTNGNERMGRNYL